ncbi:MAG: ABC transporter permease subunit [Clostridia bacterium]|nr:ABC transporter permease subunit [Clostridia bacterium]
MTSSSIKRKSVFRQSTVILLIAFFIVAVICPLFSMLKNLGKTDVAALISDKATLTAALNSLAVSSTATLISIAVAMCAAWCMTRTSVRLKNFFNLCLILPMLIPSISHGMGLLIIFGTNGTLSKLFGLTQGIYGFWGIVIGSVLYSFPVAYIMISDILKYEDSTPYEAASVLGIPKLRRFTAITLPYLKKPMISVIFAVFTMIVTDYGVPLMIGGMYKTLPHLMYIEVIGRQDFSKGSFFGLILLIPAIIAFVVDIFCKIDKRSGSVIRPFQIKKKPLLDTVAFLVLAIITVCAVFPIVSFIAITFSKSYPNDMSFSLINVTQTFAKDVDKYLINSVVIAFFTSCIGTAVSFICACFTARKPSKGARFLHLMSILSLAIPGIVLGLSYILFFGGSFIYGTLAILILANTVHFFSSPYLMIYNSIGKLNPNLEAVADSLGINRFWLVKDVILPQTKTTLAEMFSYFFVNSMMTISAVAFLATRKTKPISLVIPQFEAQLLLEASAFVSLLILASNLLMKLIIFIIKYTLSKRRNKSFTHEAID